MLLGKKKRRTAPEINSGSMSDIAFLLLVFFLLVSTVDQDKGIGLVLPGKGGEVKVSKDKITTVLVDASGRVLFNDEVIPVDEIGRRAKRLLQQNDKMIFSVQTDDNTKYQTYISVIDQLKNANALKRTSVASAE